MTEIITDLPRELRDKGWVILPKGNALRACNFRWGMESTLYALPGRAWAKKKGLSEAERRAVPAGLVEWVQQATDDVRPVLEALEAVITSAEERDRLQPRFIYSGPGRVRIVVSVAYFDWQIEPAGDAWHIASTLKRIAPVVLPASVLPAAWSRLADLYIAYNLQSHLEIQILIADELHRFASMVQIEQTAQQTNIGGVENNKVRA